MIDLLGQLSLNLTITFSDLDDSVTVAFKDPSNVLLGELKIERGRFRSLNEVLQTIAKEYFDDSSNSQGFKLSLNANAGTATVNFG